MTRKKKPTTPIDLERLTDELTDLDATPMRGRRVKSRLDRVMWASDVHFPEEDVHSWAAFLLRVVDYEPDEIILGGDILELESCSRHGGVARPMSLVEEIVYARDKLAELRTLAPMARITFLEGNHEKRLTRKTIAMMPELDGAMTIPSLLDLADLEIEWVPYGKVIRRGKLAFVHGWWTPQFHAAKHLRECGESIMYGHTHKPQTHYLGTPDGWVRAAYGMPCMRTLDAEWCDNKPLGWALGWGEISIDPVSGQYAVNTVIIIDGRAIVDGRIYSGKG